MYWFMKINRFMIVFALFALTHTSSLADTPVTIYTPEGCPVNDTYIISDGTPWFTDAEAQWWIDYLGLNAEIIETATAYYNCHGYAWMKSENRGTYWVGYYGDDPELLFYNDEAYSNDGMASYISASALTATHGCYEPNSDHSIRVIQNSYPVSSSGQRTHVSKWGSGPLVRHAPGHDVYALKNINIISYYKLKTTHYGTLSNYPKTWIGAGGIIHTITNNITSPSTQTLTIKPDVTVAFNGYYGISVSSGSKIIAEGTQYQPIVFTSATGSQPNSWYCIILYGGNNVFKHCEFKYGNCPLYLYYCTAAEGSRNLIENCNIHHSYYYGIDVYRSLANIKGCNIYNNNYHGICCRTSSDVKLIGNEIYNNTQDGILSYTNNLLEVYGNVIEQNGKYGIYTAGGDIIRIGKVYTWGSYSTIRDNGNDEVCAHYYNPNSVEISVASIHDNDANYEIYNSSDNLTIYAQSVYWNDDRDDGDAYPCAQTYGLVNIMPSVYCGLPDGTMEPWENWEGQPRTAGSPIGKISAPPLASDKEWFLDPDIPDAEKIEIGKNIIAKNPKSAEAKEALRHLYSIVRTDFRENKLGEKGKFFDYLQDIQDKYSNSEIGKRALRYMIYLRMLENDDEAVIKLSNKALAFFTGEEYDEILANMAITYTHRGELKEAKSILNELKGKCSSEDELVRIVEENIADVEWQMAQGIWEQDKTGKSLPPPEDQPVTSAFDEFAFSAIFPNPFNPITTITFSLPEASKVKAEVYDLTGRCVAVLCDRSYPVGTYSLQFDGSMLASGIYIIRSQMTSTENPGKSQIFTRKMMLMK